MCTNATTETGRFFIYLVSFLGLPYQSTTNWVVSNNKNWLSHSSGGHAPCETGRGKNLPCLFQLVVASDAP